MIIGLCETVTCIRVFACICEEKRKKTKQFYCLYFRILTTWKIVNKHILDVRAFSATSQTLVTRRWLTQDESFLLRINLTFSFFVLCAQQRWFPRNYTLYYPRPVSHWCTYLYIFNHIVYVWQCLFHSYSVNILIFILVKYFIWWNHIPRGPFLTNTQVTATQCRLKKVIDTPQTFPFWWNRESIGERNCYEKF